MARCLGTWSHSTVIPIPKKRNSDMSDSENFRGISLSSLFGKLFDNVILSQFHENLLININL